MEAIKALFISAPTKYEVEPGTYEQGKAYWLTPDQYARWDRRGRVVVAPDKMDAENERPTAAPTDGPLNPKSTNRQDPDPGTVQIPEKWSELAWPALRTLAAQLTPDAVNSKQDATAAIERELSRRATAQKLAAAQPIVFQDGTGKDGKAAAFVASAWPNTSLISKEVLAGLPAEVAKVDGEKLLLTTANGTATYVRIPTADESKAVLFELQDGSTFEAPAAKP